MPRSPFDTLTLRTYRFYDVSFSDGTRAVDVRLSTDDLESLLGKMMNRSDGVEIDERFRESGVVQRTYEFFDRDGTFIGWLRSVQNILEED